MKLIMELMELALYDIVQIATVALELFGIAVLVFTAVKCFIRWLRKDHENIRLELAQGMPWRWSLRWVERCSVQLWCGSGQSLGF